MNNKGFIIHGHNDRLKNEVARFIEKELNKEAIILHEQINKGRTIIEKFEANSDVDFAVAIWSADDFGAANGSSKTELRARQNVIFETGFLMAKLGRERVIILHESSVSIPTDLQGYAYISSKGQWKNDLRKEIEVIYQSNLSLLTNNDSDIITQNGHIEDIYKDFHKKGFLEHFDSIIDGVNFEHKYDLISAEGGINEAIKYLLRNDLLKICTTSTDYYTKTITFTELGEELKKFINNSKRKSDLL